MHEIHCQRRNWEVLATKRDTQAALAVYDRLTQSERNVAKNACNTGLYRSIWFANLAKEPGVSSFFQVALRCGCCVFI